MNPSSAPRVDPSPLIIAKTHLPPRRDELLRRPRLLDTLHTALDAQIFFITAPAGYGKTSLLIDFAHEADFPVAWYALDEFDNAPHTFLRYLIAAVRVHIPEFGAAALAALERAGDAVESFQPVIALIANDLFRLPDHLAIVLDDYHAIHNPLIDQLVAQLIRNAAENCHLYIDSRTLLRIPDQALLIARGQMSGISIHELKFTAPEIQALVQQNFDLTISDARAQELAQYTDGWISALLLMGHQAGWRALVESAITAPAAAGLVYEYLAEQVLARQSEDLRHFLLGSSILDPLSPEMLDSLPRLSNARENLRVLENQQLFLTRLGGQDLYTYHPLFRDFLRERLRHDQPDWHVQLSLACARLYAQQSQWERVVEIYLSLGRTEDAARALESAEESLRSNSQVSTMTTWLDAIPPPVVQLRPQLLSLQAKSFFYRGDMDKALLYFDRAAEMFIQTNDHAAAVDKLLWEGDALRILGRYRECIGLSEKIAALLSELDHPQLTRLRAANLHMRGISEYYLGELSVALADLTQARDLFLQTEDLVRQANVYHDLGMTARASGQLVKALEFHSATLSLWQRLQDPNAAAMTLNNLGYLYCLKGETQQAEMVLRDALQRARVSSALRAEAIVLGTFGDLHRDNTDYPQALQYYGDSLRVAQQTHDANIVLYSKIATADCYRLMGEFARAHEWIKSAAESLTPSASSADLGLVKLTQGLLATDQGRLDNAIQMLPDAASIFRQGGNRHLEAIAEFNLAHVLNLLGQSDQAIPHLMRTSELIDLLGYDHFLVVEGRRAEITLRLAATLDQVGVKFKRILDRVRLPQVHYLPPAARPRTAPVLQVFTLGQERFTLGGAEVNALRPQVREVFLFLLSRHPQGARREELWELCWQDLSAARADAVLRLTISRIRKALCPVTLANGWYALTPENFWFDVDEFERGLAEASRASTSRARVPRLQQALELYHGDYLARFEAQWVIIERERLRKAYLYALLSLAQAHAEMGDFALALRTFDKVCIEEPFLEAAWLGTMKTYLRMGNRAAALETYEHLKTILKKEMEIEPSPELQEFHRRIIDLRV
ncbi:MAG: tetratricopeptide repeat protein [Chloroflexi bacterium]|nr:tetratricopeptide repeat protein [Chloroflexota bacterium]